MVDKVRKTSVTTRLRAHNSKFELFSGIIIIMAHSVVVDDELGASPFFLRSLVVDNEYPKLREARHLLRSAASVSHDCGEMWKLAMSRLMTSL